MIPDQTTPCFDPVPEIRAELAAMFDSTNHVAHAHAASLCERCPFLDGCRDLAESLARSEISWAGVPSGTWGGELWAEGRRRKARRR